MFKKVVGCFLVAIFLFMSTSVFAQKEDIINVIISVTAETGAAAYWVEVGKAFERARPGVKINWVFPASWGDYIKKLNLALAARQGPDVAWGNADYLNVSGRGLENLEDIISIPQEYFTEDELAGMGPAVLYNSSYPDRGLVIWPWSVYTGGIGNMIVNATYLKSVGYSPDKIREKGWTIDDFVKAMQKIKAKYNADAFYLPPAELERAAILIYESKKRPMYQAGLGTSCGSPYFDLVTGEVILDEKLLARSWGWVYDLIYKYKLVKAESRGFKSGDVMDAFLKGAIVGFFGGPDNLATIKRHNQDVATRKIKGKIINAAIVPVPFVREKDFGPVPDIISTYGFYNFKQVPYKGDTHTKNVLDFCDFITSVAFQPYLAAQGFPAVDTRLYSGKYAMLPTLYDLTDPNIHYWLNFMRVVNLPGSGHLLRGLAYTPEARDAINKWYNESYVFNLEAMIYNKKTPEQAAKDTVDALKKIAATTKIFTDKAKDVKKMMDDFERQREAHLKKLGLWDHPLTWKGTK